jgi:hypothetical protein
MLKMTAGDPMDGLKNRRSIIASCVLALLAVAVVAPASIVYGLPAHRLLVAAAVGLGGTALLVAFLPAFRTRPYARTEAPCPSQTVTRRVQQSAVRETIVLDRAFNSMSSSLRETRGELGRLVDEQTALRRVAMLIAHGEPPSVVFNSVYEEVGGVLGADVVRMLRYEADEATTVIGAWGAPAGTRRRAGRRRPLAGERSHWPRRPDRGTGRHHRHRQPARPRHAAGSDAPHLTRDQPIMRASRSGPHRLR